MRQTTALFLVLALLAPAWANAAGTIEPGHTAVWRDRTRAGEGLTLEILGRDTASLAWFTYDEQGRQFWAYGIGRIVRDDGDERIEFAQLMASSGGRFAPDYDPSQIAIDTVGSATLRFADCNRGVFDVEAFGETMSLSLERLTRTMAAGCAPIHGVIGEPVKSYAGQTGVWSNPARRGQGLQLQWMSRNEAALAWYTFDTEGKRYWLSGVGKQEGGKIVFPQMIATRGARFGAAFDPADVEVFDWGRVEMEIDCDSGVVRHDSKLAEFGTGEQPIFLLTRPVEDACPWVRPKLTDLYDITIENLPHDDSSNFTVRSVADDGTVTGTRSRFSDRDLVRRKLGAAGWEVVLSQVEFSAPILVAADGSSIMLNLREPSPGSGASTSTPTLVTEDGQSSTLQGIVFDRSVIFGASIDLSKAVGIGRSGSDPWQYSWIWDAESGQRTLSFNEEVTHAIPTVVGSDGIVLGIGASPDVPNNGMFNTPEYLAVRWGPDGNPEVLRDTQGRVFAQPVACGTTCETIIGNGSLDPPPGTGSTGGAWYWKSKQEGALLQSFDIDTEWSDYWYGANDVSSDGSFVVGRMVLDGATGGQRRDALLWTQDTGAVAVKSLLEELNLPLGWSEVSASAISANGRFVLLDNSSNSSWRGAVLRLEPKVVLGR